MRHELPEYRLGFLLLSPQRRVLQRVRQRIGTRRRADRRASAASPRSNSPIRWRLTKSSSARQAGGQMRCRRAGRSGPSDADGLPSRNEGSGHSGVFAAVRLRHGHSRGLCRHRQPQGRPHGGLDDLEGAPDGRARLRCSSAATASMAMNCARSAFAFLLSRTGAGIHLARDDRSTWRPTRSRRTRCSICSAAPIWSAAMSPAAAWRARSRRSGRRSRPRCLRSDLQRDHR
jgi:hypothetical protein